MTLAKARFVRLDASGAGVHLFHLSEDGGISLAESFVDFARRFAKESALPRGLTTTLCRRL
jgi:hypothetical protein